MGGEDRFFQATTIDEDNNCWGDKRLWFPFLRMGFDVFYSTSVWFTFISIVRSHIVYVLISLWRVFLPYKTTLETNYILSVSSPQIYHPPPSSTARLAVGDTLRTRLLICTHAHAPLVYSANSICCPRWLFADIFISKRMKMETRRLPVWWSHSLAAAATSTTTPLYFFAPVIVYCYSS